MSAYLYDLINIGVESFKIEGRLKDISYLKNTVSYYRNKIDKLIEEDSELGRPSYGKFIINFQPNLSKTFTRGFTDYYISGNTNNVSSFNTPKSIGEYIGKVSNVSYTSFTYKGKAGLNNGDGLMFIDKNGNTVGTNINTVEDWTVYPDKKEGIRPGMDIYRKYDRIFINQIEKK